MVLDSIHKSIAVVALTAATGAIAPLAHAQSNPANQTSTHFQLDLITFHIAAEAPSNDQVTSGTLVTQYNIPTQQGDVVLPSIKVFIPASSQNNQGNSGQSNGFDLSTITSSGVRLGTVNMNNTRFTTKEDNLNVVPLPPAAFAGLGMLAGIAGTRYLRNRK